MLRLVRSIAIDLTPLRDSRDFRLLTIGQIVSNLGTQAALVGRWAARSPTGRIACRATINQTVTPDALRGRMNSVYSLVDTSGPRFGDIESGSVAGLTSAVASVATGGLACIIGTGVVVLAWSRTTPTNPHSCKRPGEMPGRETAEQAAES